MKNISKHIEFDSKTKSVKTTNHVKSHQKSNVETGFNFSKHQTSSSPSTFEASHQSHLMQTNMPMFNSTMDQLMNNIKYETARPTAKADDNAKKINQHDSICKLPEQFQNRSTPKKPNRIVPSSFSEPSRRDNLYSFFADPVKGPSINHLMDELSRNFSSFSDNESVKSSTSTLSKSLAENHIYEEILYECFEKQSQLDSVIGGQLSPMMLHDDPKTVSNRLNVTSFMSSLAAPNNTTLDTSLAFSHKI